MKEESYYRVDGTAAVSAPTPDDEAGSHSFTGAVTQTGAKDVPCWTRALSCLPALVQSWDTRAGKAALGAGLVLRNAGSCNGNLFPVLTAWVGETALAPLQWHKEHLYKAFYTTGVKQGRCKAWLLQPALLPEPASLASPGVSKLRWNMERLWSNTADFYSPCLNQMSPFTLYQRNALSCPTTKISFISKMKLNLLHTWVATGEEQAMLIAACSGCLVSKKCWYWGGGNDDKHLCSCTDMQGTDSQPRAIPILCTICIGWERILQGDQGGSLFSSLHG